MHVCMECMSQARASPALVNARGCSCCWTGLDWAGLDWNELKGSGVEWTGVEWTGPERLFVRMHACTCVQVQLLLGTRFFAGASGGLYLFNNPLINNLFLIQGPDLTRAGRR